MRAEGRACGQGGAECVNRGLGWRSPGGREWAGAQSLLYTRLREAGGGRATRGAQRRRPHEWGDLREGGCERVGVLEMVGASSPLAPLVCVEKMRSAGGVLRHGRDVCST